MFIKGHIAFSIDSHEFEYIHQNISVFGVTGLPWAQLNPQDHFGRQVTVNVRIPARQSSNYLMNFRTRAHLLREKTVVAEHMGLKFLLDSEIKGELERLIRANGFVSTEYLRKYPRIPYDVTLQTFPTRALCVASGGQPTILDVVNLSPNGALLAGESQFALSIRPGQRLEIMLDPRGWFPRQVEVEALVCRMTDEMDPQTKNLRRYLGVKFTGVDDANRKALSDLLKDILSKVVARKG